MKYSVNQVKSALGEAQTTLHWWVAFIKPPVAVGAPPANVEIRIQTSGVPEAQEETNKIELGGHVINQPGKTVKNGEITIQLVEGTDAEVVSYFIKLAKARWSGDGKDTQGVQRLSADLKFDLSITMCGPDDKATQKYTLVGCMARMAAGINLGQTAETVIPSVTIEYDDFHLDTGKVTW
jgi:hypothetical protein